LRLNRPFGKYETGNLFSSPEPLLPLYGRAIIKNGNEVLRFIGDAVLAIFPIAGETSKLWETQLELWKPTGGPLKRQRLFSNA